MPATTYPGTVTPLRGLNPFAESERDVLFGRDQERDELARLVTAEGYRAGLLYGESGVGKTSLLRAGLVPHLRDHGVVALLCEDIFNPEEAFAYAIAHATGQTRADHEPAIQFLSRIMAEAVRGQMFLFIIDEADLALGARTGDDRIVHELSELFARVVARSSGRARFLFSCASERLHVFSPLERRTGSLFPPSTRFELGRFQLDQAAMVLDRTLTLAVGASDPQLVRAIVQGLSPDGAILPADLQIAALAAIELGVTGAAALEKLGGTRELANQWLTRAAAATGDERAALRLVAELAQPAASTPGAPAALLSPAHAAARAGVDPAFAQQALQVLQDRGIARAVPAYGESGESELNYALTHEVLAPRVREVAAPARVAARRVYELLGSKAANNQRLTAREWYAVWREGMSPSTPAERAVLERTKRFAKIVAGVAAAVPLVLLIIIYVSLSGHYYLDLKAEGPGGGQRVVVRAGRSGLSAFHWMPHSPGFGDVVADTGFTRSMIDPEVWGKVGDRDVGGDLSGGGYAAQLMNALRPQLRGLIEYAAGNETALDSLIKDAKKPEQMAALLGQLVPIARGVPKEVSLVESALSDVSPAVEARALELAAAAEKRHPGPYRSILARALASDDAQVRRLAVSAVRSLEDDAAQALYREALALEPGAPARRELLGLVTSDSGVAAPSAGAALALLSQKNASSGARDKARSLLRRAFASSPAEAARAAAKIIGDDSTPAEDRVLILGLLLEMAPPESFSDLVEPAKQAMGAKIEAVRAAALPLYARVAPAEAAGDLALMLDNQALSTTMKEAMALAWGEVARGKNNKAAQGALETLIKDPSSRVRAAAAEAYGNVGRASQQTLYKMIKKERYDVALGAARGLANSATAGGSSSTAVGGIYQLWKKKGRARRDAARVYARMARDRPGRVESYLASAARATDDASLHPIGVEGLCNALAAGDRRAAGDLARAARGATVDVRRMVINCVADNPKELGAAGRIAVDLSDDSDSEIRAEAARVVAAMASGGEGKDVGGTLARLAHDDDRSVRIIAIRALAGLGASAPKAAIEALPRAFDSGDEAERLVILKSAQQIGTGELVPAAAADPSPEVRAAALDTAIATQTKVPATINAALSDPDPSVRRAAVERLAAGVRGLSPDQMDRALALAVGDANEGISVLALTTLARLAAPKQATERLSALLESPSERERARAALAARGLAERDPKAAIALLEPLYADPSRDVRAALIRSLATAYAASVKPAELGTMLAESETRPTRRLVVAAAFVVLSEQKGKRDAASAALEKAVKDAPPLAKLDGRLTMGLISSSADGLTFLQKLVP